MVAVPDAPSDYELIRRWQDERDEDAAEELLGRYRGLIYRYSGRYVSPALSREDALAFGLLGFALALKGFDISGSYPFDTFVCLQMRAVLSEYYQRHSRLIKRPWIETREYRKPKRSIIQWRNVQPTDCPEDSQLLSLERDIVFDRPLTEYIGEIESAYDWVEAKVWLEALFNSRHLTQKEKTVLMCRFGEDKTGNEVARLLRCSRRTVSLAQRTALAKLRS